MKVAVEEKREERLLDCSCRARATVTVRSDPDETFYCDTCTPVAATPTTVETEEPWGWGA